MYLILTSNKTLTAKGQKPMWKGSQKTWIKL